MPSNTDNSGSARAARLRRLNAARGPVPVIRPNIGSMALDAILGREPECCASSEPTHVLVNCGISPQSLDPSIKYLFTNNTSEIFDLVLTDNNQNPPQMYTLQQFDTIGPLSNLVSWQTDVVTPPITQCSSNQTLAPFSSGPFGCLVQPLRPSFSYTFHADLEPPPITIILRNASNVDTTVSIPNTNPVGPYTNFTSWRPAGCPPPS
jgi:hypothetical protein